MAVSININGLSLVHKDSGGVAKATLTDVCLTPTSSGPAPINYPNIAYSKDLVKGTTTIFADGGHMCANKGSEFSKSIGDEAGSVGGQSSGTHLAEASWITYSPDVFLEGKNACRLTDKMLMNHGNTACLSGVVNPHLPENENSDICQKIRQKIDDLINRNKRTLENKGIGTHGLKYRFAEQINGKNGPGTEVWENHSDTIERQQKALKKNINKYKKNNCGDPPSGAWSWANRPVPISEQWINPNAAFKAGVAMTVGYAIYRVIRFLPSLFPALWPTVPANLVLP